jgi:predicted O-methyltransferase YrrM
MEDRLDSSGQRLAGLIKAGDFDSAQALLRSNLKGRARSLQDDVLLVLFESPPPETALGSVAEALLGLVPDAEGFSALAEHLEANGAALAAQAAQRCAAELDFDAHPAMDVWGGAFNGQERRQTLFDQLLQELKIVTIVETGTFRGTTTTYMANAGLPVFSCELRPRYFHYSSLRLANIPNIRLERADSRRFLRELLDENLLPPGPALFYLDAHWEHDLPVWEEVDQIFSRHPSPVIMVDDFRVPTDSGFAYDDYGKGKCLSVTNLHEAVTARPSMFFPKHASAHETGARRGCVVLALGDLADYMRRKVPMLTELSLIDALILDGVADLTRANREQNLQLGLADELQQTRARSEAQLADLVAKTARLELRAHELSSAVARAEFIQQQRELEAENAKRDAAAAREMATGLQNLVLRLHEELRSGRAETLELQRTLRLAEKQVAELQHSRWRRHIRLILGLARKAIFER